MRRLIEGFRKLSVERSCLATGTNLLRRTCTDDRFSLESSMARCSLLARGAAYQYSVDCENHEVNRYELR